jgi:hypothetical protein
MRLSPTLTNQFVAYDVGSPDEVTPTASCNTVDPGDTPADTILDLGEQQNVEALAQLPGVVGKPTSDRLILPVGETVRVRWHMIDSANGLDLSSIGYFFVNDATVFTCVFSAGTATISTHEPEWEAILRTFQAKPLGSPSTSAQP